MTDAELLKSLQNKIDKYNLPEKAEDIPKSGILTTTIYNDGSTERVDRTSEFYLCKKYFVYFADNYGLYKDTLNKRIYALKLYDFQKNLIIPTYINNRFIIFRKSRQVGCSVISGIYAVWKANFNIAQEVLIVSKDRDAAQDFKAKAMLTYNALPEFMKCKATRDGQNMTTLKLTNHSRITVRAHTENAGRGGSWSLVILDEAAFMHYAEEIWDSVFPALSETKGQAIIISTSNGVGNWYHRKWIESESGENDFCPLYVPWWKIPGRNNPWLEKIEKEDYEWIEKNLKKNANEIKKGIVKTALKTGSLESYHKKLIKEFILEKEEEALSYEGPKENKPWLKLQKDNASSVRKFNQEILAKFLGSGNTVISTKALEVINEQIREPVFIDAIDENNKVKGLHVFQIPHEGITYTITIDVATGSGTDYNAFNVFRDDTLEQVAEYKDQIDTPKYAKIIKKVARHYNRAYVIVETNMGLSVFNSLFLDEEDPYDNMYYEFKRKAYRGLHTSNTNKKLMLDEFINNMDYGIIKIYGKRTASELEVYIWNKRGFPEASSGYNDDLVLTVLFLSYVIKYGNQKTKGLGFATSDQTIGREEDWEADELEESLYTAELNAQEKVQDNYGIDWDTYKELQQ